MGHHISSSNTEHAKYFNAMRYLVDPALTEDDMSNDVIDSIGYLQAVEDELMGILPEAFEQGYEAVETVRKYLVFQTAIEICHNFSQILQESESGETTRYAEIDFKGVIKRLTQRCKPYAKILGIPEEKTRQEQGGIPFAAAISRSRL